MRDFAFVRQSPGYSDLFSLCFPELQSFSNLNFDIIESSAGTYEDDKRWTVASDGYSAQTRAGCAAGEYIIDSNKYDYLLIPAITSNNSGGYVTSGFWFFNDDTPAGAGGYTQSSSSAATPVDGESASTYSLFRLKPITEITYNKIHVYVTQNTTLPKLPIIGISVIE